MAGSQVEEMRRAYAEIMLNMAKESAARVLAAERRLAALARGVAAAKEDGVAALVRLKAIMEDRIKVAEFQSLAQVRKIKELQEELNGAHNTATSLQFELQRANAELEQTRKTLAAERINGLSTCNKTSYNKNSSPHSKMHLQDRNLSWKNKKEDGAVEIVENLYHSGSDLASFMSRNKKPELYRNGCTQRIHALKQRNLNADTSLEQNSKQASTKYSRLKTGKTDAGKNPCRSRSIMEQILQTKFLANCKRKRGLRSRPSYYKLDNSGEHGKAECKSSEATGCLLLLQALEQDLPSPKVFTGHDDERLTDMNDELIMDEDENDAGLNVCTANAELTNVHAASEMQMNKRKSSATIRVFQDGRSESNSDHESDHTLQRSDNENTMLNGEQCSEMIDNCSDGHPGNSESSEMIDNFSGTPLGNNGPVLQCTTENTAHPTNANSAEFKSENSSPLSLQSSRSGIGAEGDLQMNHQECRALENKSAGCKVNVDGSCSLPPARADASVISLLDKEQNEKASSGVSTQAVGARCIRYTFNRRKRKSLCLDNTPQGTDPETSSSLELQADKQESREKPEKQDLLIESPRVDSQLVHVAEQLILLSKRKW